MMMNRVEIHAEYQRKQRWMSRNNLHQQEKEVLTKQYQNVIQNLQSLISKFYPKNENNHTEYGYKWYFLIYYLMIGHFPSNYSGMQFMLSQYSKNQQTEYETPTDAFYREKSQALKIILTIEKIRLAQSLQPACDDNYRPNFENGNIFVLEWLRRKFISLFATNSSDTTQTVVIDNSTHLQFINFDNQSWEQASKAINQILEITSNSVEYLQNDWLETLQNATNWNCSPDQPVYYNPDLITANHLSSALTVLMELSYNLEVPDWFEKPDRAVLEKFMQTTL